MKIKFKKYQSKLDINKTSNIKPLIYRNFSPDLKFHFPSGATEILTYESNKHSFSNLFEFYMHIRALPYLNFFEYNLPNDFFNKSHYLEKLSKKEFKTLSDGYLDSFADLSEDSLWVNKLNMDEFEDGYSVRIEGSGLFLIGSKDPRCPKNIKSRSPIRGKRLFFSTSPLLKTDVDV